MKYFRLSGKPMKQLINDLGQVLVKTPSKGLITLATLNPEQVVQANTNDTFRHVLSKFKLTVADGAGIVWAVRLRSRKKVYKISGVDLGEALVAICLSQKFSVMFLGGGQGVAKKAKKHFLKFADKNLIESKLATFMGYKNIHQPSQIETNKILKKIKKTKPRLLLVGYGAPFQELWIDAHKKDLEAYGVRIAMVVGGSFDYWSRRVPRAPRWLRQIHLEWLYRLIKQPWRFKRQVRLFKFVWLVLTKQIDFKVK